VHGPLQVPDSYLDKFSFIDTKNRQLYHAMVNYLDDVVGELVNTLKKKGLGTTYCL
jgi:arylsulfatase I/J